MYESIGIVQVITAVVEAGDCVFARLPEDGAYTK
jgi:hypothetical protein